jgi:hypothetical protein
MATHVYVLTRCRRMDRFFATALVFKTLRTGFPTFTVHVVDNASLQEARPALHQLARDCGASFLQIERDTVC